MKKSNGNSDGVVPLVVTTVHRGVFFGFGVPTTDKTIRITDAQMCVAWSKDVRGVLGLASDGPSKHCRVGPAVPAITLQDVTSVIEASEKASAAWQAQPWS